MGIFLFISSKCAASHVYPFSAGFQVALSVFSFVLFLHFVDEKQKKEFHKKKIGNSKFYLSVAKKIELEVL